MEKYDWQQTALGALLGIGLSGIAQASDLTDLLRQTLDNPGISAREFQSQAAGDDATAANMRYFGQASVFAGQTRYESPRIVGVFAPGVTPLPVPVSNDITQYGVNYHLPVDVFGSIAAERQQAQAGRATAQLLERQETLLRLHQTLGAYVRLQALAAQSQALQAEQKQLEVYADRVREEVKLGRTAKIDLSLVQSDLARLAAQQAIFSGNQRAAVAALKASANATNPVISANIGVPVLQNTDAQSSLPVLLANEQQKTADAANQKAHRNLYPAFSVDSQYANFNGGGLVTQPHNVWSVGINMNIPIDPVGMKSASAATQRARVAEQQAQAAQADTIAQIATLEANYQSAIENASALAAEVEHRQEVVTIQREKWHLGASTMDELLYQERNLLDVQYAYADARAQAATAWSGMQVLLGTPSAEYIHSLEITP
ncbi:TolC family protein [Sideroxydans sp. CL21]|uniref:TolC family protein n=1 Tax=Sideroxydans sp. CL21 TaxID=2600596 RepID=UPI0024BD0CB8|nr:TolC family protein [Sideroxydans sp. CL21]